MILQRFIDSEQLTLQKHRTSCVATFQVVVSMKSTRVKNGAKFAALLLFFPETVFL